MRFLAMSFVLAGVSGCGRAAVAPTPLAGLPRTQVPATPTQPRPANPLAGLPRELPLILAEAAPDFADATVKAIEPLAGDRIDEPDAPTGALPDGADFALAHPATVQNQILVKLAPNAQARVAGFTARTGVRVVQSIALEDTYQVLSVPEGMTVAQALEAYKAVPGVESVQENRVYGPAGAVAEPNDPYFDKQWGMKRIQQAAVLGAQVNAQNVTVAVLDTGIDYRHPDLQGHVLIGWNFAAGNNDIMDRFGHGTHVSGIIGASANNSVGVVGVAPNVKLMGIKVLGDDGRGSTAAVVGGIKYAADYGAKIINMSLGSPDTTIDPAIQAAIAYANQKGVMVIAAAGNNRGDVGSPANDPGAIAVSSTSQFLWFEYLSWFSNRGPKVEVSAPGGSIWSTVPLDPNRTGSTGYGKLSGTSMAAPVIAGAAAVVYARHPNWNVRQVHQAIDTAVVDKGSNGRDSRYGYGRVDLAKLVTL
jgi:subtilisin family serine protease